MTRSDPADIGVKGRHHPIKSLDHRDLTAESGINICKFKADITTADDGEPARKPLQIHGLVAGEHAATIGLNTRRNKGIRSCRQNHILRRQHPVHTTNFPHTHGLSRLQTTGTTNNRHPRSLQRFGEVCANRGHQLVGMISDFLAFKAHRGRMNSETRQMLRIGQLTDTTRSGEQSLGRNAAPIHTGPAHVARLDNRDLQAMLSGMLRCIETAVTGTDHDHIEVETGVAHPDCCMGAVIVARRRSKRSGTAAAATFKDSTFRP